MDTQRTAIGRFIMGAAGVLVAFDATQDFSSATIPVSLFVIAMGVYGLLATQKLYERQEWHFSRSRESLRQLDELLDAPIFQPIRDQCRVQHYQRFRLATRMESRMAWFYLHLLVTVSGVGIVIFTLMKSQ